jgi:hypothetical protein
VSIRQPHIFKGGSSKGRCRWSVNRPKSMAVLICTATTGEVMELDFGLMEGVCLA